MPSPQIITKGLWITPIVLESLIVISTVARKLIVVFPLFFSYIVLVLGREVGLWFIPYSGDLYARVYWYGEAVIVIMALASIFETMQHLFPRYALIKPIVASIWGLVGAAAIVAITMLVFTEINGGSDRPFEWIILAERSVRFLQACWLILVIALASRWRNTQWQYPIGIVSGFGIYSALTLALLEVRTHLHLISNETLVMLNSAAYNVAAIIWAAFFLRSWHVVRPTSLPEANLAEWNTTITQYNKRKWFRRF